MTRQELFGFVIDYFRKVMPEPQTELEYNGPFYLAVAVILSAQCTDKRVNEITPQLLKDYPGPREMAKAEPKDIFEYIKSCSYPNNKAKHLVGMARVLTEKYNGIMPGDIEELQKLPGVGRKSANVIASVAFNRPAMAVDTHVFRVSARIGLTIDAKTPLIAEKQLVEYIPEYLLPKAHHWLILHGRYVCMARAPKCNKCGLTAVCNYFKSNVLSL